MDTALRPGQFNNLAPLATPKATPKAPTDSNILKQGEKYAGGIVQYDSATGLKLAPGATTLKTPKVSTTTLSNGNKIDTIPSLNNTLAGMETKGVVTDTQTGISSFADGTPVPSVTETETQTIYNPQINRDPSVIASSTKNADGSTTINYKDGGSQVIDGDLTYKVDSKGNRIVTPTSANDTSADDAEIKSILANMQATSDASTAATIKSIQDKYARLKAEQAKINESTLAATQGGLFRSGAAKYDAYAQNTIQVAINNNAKEIQDLEYEEQDLINQAKAAQSTQNFKFMEKALQMAETKRAEKMEATQKLNEQILEAEKKARERAVEVNRDTAIADLYSQGITDVPSILAQLKEAGISATSKEISDTLKNTGIEDINQIMSDAAKNGAPLDVLQKIGQARSVTEANILASDYMQDPLDVAYKKAQIAKINKDIETSGIGESLGTDAASLIAYAQQYAADGKIPTGIPKGSFGIIAQIAKETPKQKGQIIDVNTGVVPTGDTTLATSLAGLSSVVDLAKQLKELDKERIGGVLGGVTGKVLGSSAQTKYLDLRSQIIDLLSRARSGAALTIQEEERYSKMLPGRFSESFFLGADSDVKIDNFIRNISSDLDNKARAKGWAVYGISTVDTPAGKKTVGETVELPNGVKGRINADATVTTTE